MFQQHAVFRIFPNSTPFIIDDVVIHEGVVLSKVSKISREIFVFMTWICQIELIVSNCRVQLSMTARQNS